MALCKNNCFVIMNKLHKLAEYIQNVDRHGLLNYFNEQKCINLFENDIVPYLPEHQNECVTKSLNTTIMKHTFRYPCTIIDVTIYYGMFSLACKLIDSGADYTVREGFNDIMCTIVRKYMGGNRHSIHDLHTIERVRFFFSKDPKTKIEEDLIRYIIQRLTIRDISLLLEFEHEYIVEFANILGKYHTNLDYDIDDSENVHCLLIKMLNISKLDKSFGMCHVFLNANRESKMCQFFEAIISRYDFMVSNPKFNVLEYAHKMKRDNGNNKFCKKVINYCSRREILDSINTLLPIPIAEEIVPNIITRYDNY